MVKAISIPPCLSKHYLSIIAKRNPIKKYFSHKVGRKRERRWKKRILRNQIFQIGNPEEFIVLLTGLNFT